MTPDVITTTATIDPIFFFIFGVCAVMLLGITVAMIWFVYRYNRKRCPEPLSQKDHNVWLETIWTIIPTILVLMMFWYGWSGYLSLRQVPEGAMEVTGKARMWSWLFVYENGKTSNKLHVPVGQPVKVKLVAEDVLHAFYVPAFRVKRDSVPGMETYVWFTADEPGSYDIYCAEYCGVGHADMTTSVEAMAPDEFDAWVTGTAETESALSGLTVVENYGCTGCHSLDGSDGPGPTFAGLRAGVERTVTVEGVEQKITVDATYLRKAIEQPKTEMVTGFDPMMPPFAGLPEGDIRAMVDYLLGVEVKTGPDGAEVFDNNGCGGCHSVDGSDSIGPTLKGLFSGKIDREYLRRALLDPEAELVEGYAPMMPAFDYLAEDELNALLDYLESL